MGYANFAAMTADAAGTVIPTGYTLQDFVSDAGTVIAQGWTAVKSIGNGAVQNVRTIATGVGATATSTGVSLLGLEVGTAGAIIAPLMGVGAGAVAGMGLYSANPQFWTDVSNALEEAGQTIGGQVAAFVRPDGSVSFSEDTLQIFKDALEDSGILSDKTVWPEPATTAASITATNLSGETVTGYMPAADVNHFRQLNRVARFPTLVNISNIDETYTFTHFAPLNDASNIIPYSGIFCFTYVNEGRPFFTTIAKFDTQPPQWVYAYGTSSITGEIARIQGNLSDWLIYDNAYYTMYTYSGNTSEEIVNKAINLTFGALPTYNLTTVNELQNWLAFCAQVSYDSNPALDPSAVLPNIYDNISDFMDALGIPSIPDVVGDLSDKVGWPVGVTGDGTQTGAIDTAIPGINAGDDTWDKILDLINKGIIDAVGDISLDIDIPDISIPDVINPTLDIADVTYPEPPSPPKPNPPSQPDINIPPILIPDAALPSLSSAGRLYTVYKVTDSILNSLGGYLWSTDVVDIISKIWTNPLDCIIALFRIWEDPTTSTSKNIHLGAINTNISAPVVSQQFKTVSCGSVTISELNKNATDYPPYLSITLFLPFVGFVELDPTDCMGSTITIEYKIDFWTGVCLAQVKFSRHDMNNNILYTFNGNMSQQLPLTGANYAGVISSLLTAGIGAATLASGGATTPVLASVAGATLGHEMIHVSRSGSLSANAGIMGQKTPYIIISRRATYNATGYANIKGYPANKTVRLGNCSGFTRVLSCNLGINATDTEKDMIETALKKGVII